MMMKQTLLFFLKYPNPGEVKTRLGREIGHETASSLYRAFVRDMLRNISDNGWNILIYADPETDIEKYRKWLGEDWTIAFQSGEDLGSRMMHAFEEAFEKGIEYAALIGSDLPALHPVSIRQAFSLLGQGYPCLGPAEDGGYYLIGLNRNHLHKHIFSDIKWSTPAVLQTTVGRMKNLGLQPKLLPELGDVDTLSDLKKLRDNPEFTSLCLETAKVMEGLLK